MTAEDESDPWRREAADVVAGLGTDEHLGLSTAESRRRLDRFGPNQLQRAAVVPAWRKLLVQFADPLIYLLLAAVVVIVNFVVDVLYAVIDPRLRVAGDV